MRTAVENGVDVKDIIHYAVVKGLRIFGYLLASMDVMPEQTVDLNILAELVGQPMASLKQMTLYHAVEKFPSHNRNGLRSACISPLVEKKVRRYCPECVREKLPFQLLWQIREIEVCHVHLVKLSTQCRACGAEQLYNSSSLLTKYSCENCNEIVVGVGGRHEKVTGKFLTLQERIYRDWGFLVSKHTLLGSVFESSKKDIATALLSCCQHDSTTFDRDSIQGLSRNLVSRLLMVIKNTETRETVPLPHFLTGLRLREIELKDFATKVPEREFVESIQRFLDEDFNTVVPQNCLAPWCSFYGENSGMRRVYRIKNRFFHNGKSYSDGYVCIGCYCKYGHEETFNTWTEMGCFISEGWFQVKPLLEHVGSNDGLKTISRHLGIPLGRLRSLIAYLVRNGLVNQVVVRRFEPKSMASDVVNKFKGIDYSDGNTKTIAMQMYGWSEFEYQYYRHGWEGVNVVLKKTEHGKEDFQH